MGKGTSDLLALAAGTFVGAHPGTSPPPRAGTAQPAVTTATADSGATGGRVENQRNRADGRGNVITIGAPASAGLPAWVWVVLVLAVLAGLIVWVVV